MLSFYGTSLSSPSNKVRFLLNYLGLPYEFISLNLAAGEQKQADFLKINPYGKVPAINDNGFCLAESNAILRYLAEKTQSELYPRELKERALVEQALDFAAMQIGTATAKIMMNTYFYRLLNISVDERSLQEGRLWLDRYLPVLEDNLNQHAFIASNKLSIADIALLSALDVAELIDLSFAAYPKLKAWRNKLMAESFYQSCHTNFTANFKAHVGFLLEEKV